MNAPNLNAITDRRGFSVPYALALSGLMMLVVICAWESVAAIQIGRIASLTGREANLIADDVLHTFQAGGTPSNLSGQFSNGYAFRQVVAQQTQGALTRLTCDIYWETAKAMPADPLTATNHLSISTVRFSP